MSAAEVMILLIVGIVVVGPKRLPEMMRKAGQWVAKMRRLSTDLRAQSGIDRILREEGLEKEIRELRALRESLSKHALFDSLVAAANKPATSPTKAVSGGATTGAPARALPVSAPKPPAAAPADKDQPGASSADDEKPAQPVLATGSDDTETTSTASALIKPAPGAMPRGAGLVPSANRTPYRSFRDREYPSYGPDHYEAFPDDLDDSDATDEVAAAAAEATATEPRLPPPDPSSEKAAVSAKESSP